MVRLEGISKSYNDKPILKNFSLEISKGERFVLLGPSGCGKTTLLRLIAGFETPDQGSLLIEGKEVNRLPVEKRSVGFIFQHSALFPHLQVYDNIAVGPRTRGIDESEITKQIDELLKIIRLPNLKKAWPHQLSGGESQRVALARAIINRPKILLLDEPLSALDESLRQRLQDELIEMQRAFEITFLFVTHDQQEALILADRMAVLEKGQLLQIGTPEDLYCHPQHPFVAEFLGDLNCLNGIVETTSRDNVEVMVPKIGKLRGISSQNLNKGQQVNCYIRPEKMILCGRSTSISQSNEFLGNIKEKKFFGSHYLYKIQLIDGSILHLKLISDFMKEVDKEQVKIKVQTDNVFIFPTHMN